MKMALLGFPQSGKKTFFSLLTGRSDLGEKAGAAMQKGESLEGIAPVHDPRVDVLSRIFKPEKTRYAENTIVICPDVIDGSGKGKWLETARRCELLCILIRAFTSEQVYHPTGSVDARRDRSTMESELLLADLELIENRLERIAKEKKAAETPLQVQEERSLLKIKETIESTMQLVSFSLEPHEQEPIKSLGLLTLKPVLWVYNVDEDRLKVETEDMSGEFSVSCRIEQEIMALDSPEERDAYLRDLGMNGSGLDRLNQAVYDALGLMSFYTVVKNEVRAWTIRKGSTALVAAGKVHSDIERGFIRVEIIKYNDLVAAGSESEVRAQGKVQVKGRDYVIEDGDICHFRFNV